MSRRYFLPKRTDDLNERCLPFVGKWVTVESWHDNCFPDKYKESEKVGFIKEFYLDIPEEELLMREPS